MCFLLFRMLLGLIGGLVLIFEIGQDVRGMMGEDVFNLCFILC